MQNVPGQNLPGQNNQRYFSGQNFETPDRGIQDVGYEQDERRNRYVNDVSSYGDGQEHFIQQQSGYINYRSERDFRHDVGPTPPINYHRPYLNTTEQGLREYSPRSADTHRQSAQSQMHTQAQYPSDHERETRSNDYNPYDMVPQKIHSTIPPERPQEPLHLSSQTTQSDNRMSSESPQNRDFNVVKPSRSRKGSIDMTQMEEPRGLVTISRESSEKESDGTKKQLIPSVIVQSDTDPSSGLCRTPSFVQRQIIEIENAASQIGQDRIVHSHSFSTAPPEIEDKEKRYAFDSGRMVSLLISSEGSSHMQLSTNKQFQDQIGSGVHGQPTSSSFSPNPVISTGKPDVSAQYPDISAEYSDISAGKPYISAEYPHKSSKYPSISTKSAKDSSRSSTQDKLNRKGDRKKTSEATSVARKDRKIISEGEATECQNDTETEETIEASPVYKVDKTTKGKLNEEGIGIKSEQTSKSRDDGKEMSTGESIESQNDTETEESIEASPEPKVDKTTKGKFNEEGIEKKSEQTSKSRDDDKEMSAGESIESQKDTETEENIEASPEHKVDKTTKSKLNEEEIGKKSEQTSKSRDDVKEMSLTGESIESQNDTDTDESIEQSPELKERGKTTQNRKKEEGIWGNMSEASSSAGGNNDEDSADDSRESQNKEDSS